MELIELEGSSVCKLFALKKNLLPCREIDDHLAYKAPLVLQAMHCCALDAAGALQFKPQAV